ncbi:MAG: 4Fe-4S dicluster domain-containing protein [Bdellovibrionales bacterium]|nr:4Fe-4S dicluster domain-containing protein [Bdellovibrionales bacterium]
MRAYFLNAEVYRMEKFVPANFQPELPMDELILRQTPEGDDVVPMDVIFVGAGPAGLAGAIKLAQLVKDDPDLADIEIGVLEKGETLGEHSLSGSVVNPKVFRELFPELKDKDFPFRKPVKHEKVFLMSETGTTRLPTPPTMKNAGNYTASLSEMVRWLGDKAEELGVNILPSFPADSLYVEGDRVVGVKTTPMGLVRDGSPGDQHMPATDLTAQITVLSEGTRGTLAQAFYNWQNTSSKYPQIYALGVKEIWKLKKPAPDYILHTLGYPLPLEVFGGSWMYPLSDDTISLGLVAGLDYRDSNLDVHNLLQHMKQHPLFADILEGGECIEWGAKTIPEGGYNAISDQLTGNGIMVLGDSAGTVNVPALKGIHYAMKSGALAAETIFKALKAKDTSKEALKEYDTNLRESWVGKELKAVRNMRHAFKDGFYSGGMKAAIMTLTGGAFPGDGDHPLDDAEEWKYFGDPEKVLKPTGLSKVDAVYLSGNKTRDDIPQHLTVGKDISPEMADFYSHLCPAGVYERQGDKLVVNAPNCVDCKATDVLGPRWRPREGGSGPKYKEM